jgi:ABC-type multidrug transport system ATPase subunit
MTLVTLDKVVRRFGDYAILDGLSLRVDEGDRIGVVGDNGAGKTTMIRILAGVDDADLGQRNTRKDLRIAYGAQMPAMPKGTTVLDLVLRGTGEHDALERRMRELEARMAGGDEAALRAYGELQAAFEAGGGYDRKHRVEKVLAGIGFPLADLAKDVSVLSGGEKSRVQLAILMTTPADLLILDEPTNHLDLQGIEFVEDFVVRYPGACVVVSHDRRFLDAIANAIVEVADGVANRWKGNFSHYSKQRDLALLTQARAFKSQREFVEKEMEYIRRNMAGRMSAQAKGRLKRLQRLLAKLPGVGEKTALRYVLRLLEQDGWIALSENANAPARVHIKAARETLYDYQLRHKNADILTKAMLRAYPGVQNDLTAISEQVLAQYCKTNPESVKKILESARQEGILEYLPAVDKPQLSFLRERVAVENLQIDLDRYRFRKARAMRNAETTIQYAETRQCRSRQLVGYFGEKNSADCGICDVCTGRNKTELSNAQYDSLSAELRAVLQNGPQSTEELLAPFAAKRRETAIIALQYMLNEGIIREDEVGRLALNA